MLISLSEIKLVEDITLASCMMDEMRAGECWQTRSLPEGKEGNHDKEIFEHQ
jgi:hypothetical protein